MNRDKRHEALVIRRKAEGPLVAVIAAMDMEIRLLEEQLMAEQVYEEAGQVLRHGVIGGCDVVLVTCGVGPVNAALVTQLVCTVFKPEVLINTGIAGALDPHLQQLDLVAGTDACYHDVGEENLDLYTRGYRRFRSDRRLLDLVQEACPPGATLRLGGLASGNNFIASGSDKDRIYREIGALAVDMESAAIAQTAVLNAVPMLSLRAVSDMADDEAELTYEQLKPLACALSAETVLTLIPLIRPVFMMD